MTVWAEGSGRFMDEGRFRTIPAREFVRRFRRGVAHDEKTYTWLIGAGASVSSGVETAADCVRRWSRDLKYVETGEEGGVEEWMSRRFTGYDPSDPAAVYGPLLQELFQTAGDRRAELERMIDSAEPGFGYATLAQLMTHPKWGPRTNFGITTNFDDLFADALHIYSQRRPQVFTHESLGRSTPVSPQAPTIVKAPGDAHLDIAPGENRAQLPSAVRERLRDRLTETGLIVLGYGGRDMTLLDLLDGLPTGAPAGGLFWVNEAPPRGAFGDELQKRGAIWVRHGDFDELMYFTRLEFGLGHPTIGRFERVFRKYDAQYRELSTRAGLAIDRTEPGGRPAIGDPEPLSTPTALGGIAARRETEESRRERLRQSLHAYSRALAGEGRGGSAADKRTMDAPAPPRPDGPSSVESLLGPAALELYGGGLPPGAETGRAAGADASGAPDGPVSNPSVRLVDDSAALGAGGGIRRGTVEEAEELPTSEAVAWPSPGAGAPDDDSDGDARPAESVDSVLAQLQDMDEIAIPDDEAAGRRDGAGSPDRFRSRIAQDGVTTPVRAAGADRLAAAGRAVATRSRRSPLRVDAPAALDGLPATPVRRLPADQAAAGDMSFAAALDTAPHDAALRVRRATYLAVAAGDLRRAEEEFEVAQQTAPDSVSVLRDYARFALEHLRDGPRAERLLTRALNLDLRNAETLRALARYLLRARGDLEEAENCLRLAIEVAPTQPDAFIDYARFLDARRGRRDAAEAQLRRAAALKPPSGRALAELALHHTLRAASMDQAEKTLAEAERLGADEPEVALARAQLAERTDKLSDAEAHYRRALELNPAEFRARRAYVRYLIDRSGDLDAAEAQLREGVAVAPNEGEPLSLFAQFLEAHRSDPRAAETYHRKAVEAEPYNPVVLSAFADYLATRDDMVDEADALFRDALALSQRSSPVLRAYGRFLANVKHEPDAAEAQFRQAVDADPNDPETLDDLAQFLHQVREDADEAELFFREALRVAPNRSETLNRFAGFLRETRRDLDEAERFYRRALENKPKDAATLARAAQFLLAEGRRQEGLNMLTESFDAAWRMSAANRPPSLLLELWIYRYAHDPNRQEDALKAAMTLIDSGVRCDGWDMGPTIETAVRAGHSDPETLRALAAVACDGADANQLRRRRR